MTKRLQYCLLLLLIASLTMVFTQLSKAQTIDSDIVTSQDTVFAMTSDVLKGTLRSEPVLGNNIIATIPKSSVVHILGYKKGSPYLKVIYREKVGWLSFGGIDRDYRDSKIITDLKNDYGKETTNKSSKSNNPYQKPEPPHGEPDRTHEYESGSYKSVTYTYFCLNGKYRTFEYVKGKLGKWKLESKSTSDGICY